MMITEEYLKGCEISADNLDSEFSSHIADQMRSLVAEVRTLRAGEFICKQCGIRKDADKSGKSVDF